MTLSDEDLVVLVEAAREYRLRLNHNLVRRALLDALIIRLLAQLTKQQDEFIP